MAVWKIKIKTKGKEKGKTKGPWAGRGVFGVVVRLWWYGCLARKHES